MSTRACIAVWDDEKKKTIRGKYHHSDGYTEGLGLALQKWVIKNGFEKTISVLIDSKEARAGWSAISFDGDATSFGFRDGSANDSYFCRGDTDEDDIYTMTEIGIEEYTYVLDENLIHVYYDKRLLGKVNYDDFDKMKKLDSKV